MRIQNSSLSAAFTTLVGDTNTALEATLQFSVVANTNNISKIELFSTGGSLTNVLSQSNVVFSVAGTNLGLGLHPFYAVVTASSGKQYRTDTKWIRLVGQDSPFRVSLAAPPPRLAWPAAAGRSYDILTATNLTNAFQAERHPHPLQLGPAMDRHQPRCATALLPRAHLELSVYWPRQKRYFEWPAPKTSLIT